MRGWDDRLDLLTDAHGNVVQDGDNARGCQRLCKAGLFRIHAFITLRPMRSLPDCGMRLLAVAVLPCSFNVRGGEARAPGPVVLDDRFDLPSGFHLYGATEPEFNGGSDDPAADGQGRVRPLSRQAPLADFAGNSHCRVKHQSHELESKSLVAMGQARACPDPDFICCEFWPSGGPRIGSADP